MKDSSTTTNRRPPWIKLYRDLWDDPRFFELQERERYVLIGIFVLASQHENRVSASQSWLQAKLRIESQNETTGSGLFKMTISQIKKALRMEDLMLPGETRDDAFRRLAKLCHPDTHPGNKPAEEAFKHLTNLREEVTKEIKIGKWTISQPFARGDIADLYVTKEKTIFKIARSEKDNDLMTREKQAIQLIHKDVSSKMRLYVPNLVESIKASGRTANVIAYADEYLSLEEILQRTGPLDFRHAVWMMNRMLSVLGYVHRLGLVHGAIVPSHLLYNPANHTLQLVDWCYSTKIGEKVPAIVKKYKFLYPDEILKRSAVHSSSDLYMALGIIRILTGSIPKQFQPLLDWGQAGSPASRPQDPWAFQDRWRSVAKELYGEPKFIPLTIPVN